MRTPHPLHLTAALLLIAGSGCFSTHERSVTAPSDRPFAAPVEGVTAPDSLAAGQPLTVKVHTEIGGCVQFYGFDVLIHADSIFITPLNWFPGPPGPRACPAYVLASERDCVVTPPGSGLWTLVVTGSSSSSTRPPTRLVLPVVVGTAAAPVKRYEWQVLDRTTLQPIPHAGFTLLRGDKETYPPDTVAVLTTSADGRVRFVAPCTDPDSAYGFRAEFSGYYSDRWFWTAARCGVPERGVILVQH